jgi:excisionase family DNA binding protein
MALLTSSEVARILRVSRPTVRGMLQRRELEGFLCGRILRVTADSVERLAKCGIPPRENAAAGTGARTDIVESPESKDESDGRSAISSSRTEWS